MAPQSCDPLINTPFSGTSLRFRYPVRLLIYMRWIAILGQTTAVLASSLLFGDQMPLPMVISIIGLAIFVNLILTFFTGPRRRIPTDQVFYYLLYDLGQLGALLFVTGGLNNPFVVLVLTPVVIAAGFLSYRKALLICFVAILMVHVLAFSPYPLPWEISGFILPDRLRGGILIALIIAILFIAYYTKKIAGETNSLTRALQATEMALSREQRLASLGALAAAAAHELGSPLTTITLIAKELQDDPGLTADSRDDMKMLLGQANRCRDILQDLALNCSGNHVLPHEELPITAAIEAIIQPHIQGVLMSGKGKIPPIIEVKCGDSASQGFEPYILLGPEIMHGLGNIFQNAIQFASTKVLVLVNWTSDMLIISLKDDGPGYPQGILDKLGDPYVSGRRSESGKATDDGIHLGLGLFIAQTLLAQRGAKVYFENAGLETIIPPGDEIRRREPQLGAGCTIIWPRSFIDIKQD